MTLPERTEMLHPWDRRLGVWYIAEDQPDAMAIIESPQGTRTYGELADNAHQLVHTFQALGVQAGDVVAVMCPNGVDLIETGLACHEGGFMFTPLNTSLTSDETAAIVEHSGCKLLIVHERFGAILTDENAAITKLVRSVSVGSVPNTDSLDDLRLAHPTTIPTDRRTGGLFPYSSGTTGKPKGIKRAVGGSEPSKDANDSAIFGRAFDFKPFEGPHLVSAGMFHGGAYAYYIGALHVGHALVIMAKFDPEETLRLIEKYRITTAYMVPTQFVRLLRLSPETRAKYDVSSLHAVVHSAAPCPRDVKEQMMAWWGPVIWETYGGMEGAATVAKPTRWLEKPGTVGRAVKGVTLTILDDDGKELGPNEIGQIYMETASRFAYHRDDAGTQEAFRDKRHTIGDVGYLDDDGYLFISDRIKDMIISGGVNVYPAEVEALLQGHPSIEDVAVIGVPDAEWGESVKAVVAPRDGVTPSDALAQEILAYCREHLSSYKCPRTVDFRKTLPRTEAGKLYKRKIRDEYWSEAGRSV
jgi:long-chain acyl-CoA synthetase